jgi:hypothetical protein
MQVAKMGGDGQSGFWGGFGGAGAHDELYLQAHRICHQIDGFQRQISPTDLNVTGVRLTFSGDPTDLGLSHPGRSSRISKLLPEANAGFLAQGLSSGFAA